MFCPQCKAEYRQGFTRCSDCNVDLVWELPKDALVPHQPAAPGDPEDPFCSFWKGDDPRLHTELCELLDEEGIPHKTVRRADHLFHISKYPAFQIGIPFSMFDRAEAAVKEAYGTEEEQQDAAALWPYQKGQTVSSHTVRPWLPEPKGFAWSEPETEDETESELATAPEEAETEEGSTAASTDWDPQNWFPEDATAEVWTGDEPEMAELVCASLSENHIHSRSAEEHGRQKIFVLPEDEAGAREIVREIVDGVAPK